METVIIRVPLYRVNTDKSYPIHSGLGGQPELGFPCDICMHPPLILCWICTYNILH